VNLLRAACAATPKIAFLNSICSKSNNIAPFLSLRSLSIVFVPRASRSVQSSKMLRFSNGVVKANNACEHGYQVRVREWVGRSSKLCWLNENNNIKEQPSIRNYKFGECFRVPGMNESYSFSGCYNTRRALLNEYVAERTTGTRAKRRVLLLPRRFAPR